MSVGGRSPANVLSSQWGRTREEVEATLVRLFEAQRKNITVREFVNLNHCHKNFAQKLSRHRSKQRLCSFNNHDRGLFFTHNLIYRQSNSNISELFINSHVPADAAVAVIFPEKLHVL